MLKVHAQDYTEESYSGYRERKPRPRLGETLAGAIMPLGRSSTYLPYRRTLAGSV